MRTHFRSKWHALRSLTLVAALAGVAVSPPNAKADPLSLQPEIVITRVATGQAPFDATTYAAASSPAVNAGYDADANNDVVRTSQLTNFRFDLSLNDPQAAQPERHGNFTVTADPLPLGFVWDKLPAVCTGPGSGLTGDGISTPSVLVCNMGRKETGDVFFVTASIRAMNTVPNGTSFAPKMTVSVDDTTNTSTKVAPTTYATSSPQWDLTKRYYGVVKYQMGTDRNGATVPGSVHSYSIGVKGPAGGGSEPFAGTTTGLSNFTMVDDFSGLPSTATFLGCLDTASSNLPNAAGNPVRHPYGNGTTACVVDYAAKTVAVNATDVNMGPPSFPTQAGNGASLAVTDQYVYTKTLQFFVPYESVDFSNSDAPGVDADDVGGTRAENKTVGLSGTGMHTGATNYANVGGEPGVGMNNDEAAQSPTTTDDGFQNDSIVTMFKPQPGTFDKYDYHYPMTAAGAIGAENTSSAIARLGYTGTGHRSGDAYLTRGTTFTGTNSFGGFGLNEIPAGVNNCAVFDNKFATVTEVNANPVNDGKAAFVYPAGYVAWRIEYGVGGTAGNLSTQYTGHATWADDAAMRSGTCLDADSPIWVTSIDDPALAAYGGAKGITKVRAISLDTFTRVEQLTNNYQSLMVNYQVREDAPFGSIGSNYASLKGPPEYCSTWCTSNYDKIAVSGGLGDRYTVVGTRVRVDKKVSASSIAVGGELTWTLTPSVGGLGSSANSALNLASNVVVTDVLPAEAIYQPGSASCERGGPGLCEPDSITLNADGTTTLVWNLGTRQANVVIAPIVFKTDVVPDAADATTIINKVVISSTEDNSPEFDPRFSTNDRSDFEPVILSNPKAFSAAKVLVTPQVEVGDNIAFNLRYTNTSGQGYSTTDFIDWLPFNGDQRTPPSTFSGTAKLVSFTKLSGSQVVLLKYTNFVPTSLVFPADLAPSTANPAIVWCEESQFGSAGCPASMAAVTGIRMMGEPIQAGQRTVFRMVLDTDGNAVGDLYTNRFRGDISGLALPAESNNRKAVVTGARLGNFVFKDLNGDGIQQANEPGVPGVSVKLAGTDKNGAAPRATTATTDLNGQYQYPNLISNNGPVDYSTTGAPIYGTPGAYELTFDPATLPAGYVFTEQRGAAGAIPTNSDAHVATGKTGPIVLAPSANDQTWDAGIVRPATISGFVYVDPANDGIKVGTDAGIAGITILLTGVDGRGNPVSMTTTTDANGFYEFTGLLPGSYTVTEVQADVDALELYNDGKTTTGTLGTGAGATLVGAGTVLAANPNVLASINLTQDLDSENNNFGEPFKPAAIEGNVFTDPNNDGLAGTDGAPIAGVLITLTGTDVLGNPVTRTTTTDAAGHYAFEGLMPGTYTVTETQPTTYVDGKDTAGTVDGSTIGTATNDVVSTITLDPDERSIENNFAELVPAKLSGKVIDELTGLPIAGVQIVLTGTDDLGNTVTYTTYTAADGTYSFTNLRPGTYTVTETQPAGYIDGATPVTPGTTGGTAGTNTIKAITLGQGDNSQNNDFAESKVAALTGKVYHDKDNDGVFDPTDEAIPGTIITLTGTDDQGNPVTMTTTTGADGSYAFTGLRPGTYTVKETQPAGFTDGKDTLGTVDGAATGTTTNDTHATIVIGANQSGVEYNFGEIKGASLSGHTYVDADASGTKSAGDPAIAGVKVTLTGTDLDGNPVTVVTYSDANGFYEFAGLKPGNYTVTEEQPAGYVDGPETAGSNGGTAATNSVSAITISSGDAAVNYDLGELPTADLAITKKIVSAGPFAVGTNVTYAFTVVNTGPSKATNVQVTETWPAGLSYVSHSGGMYSNSTKIWQIPSLDAGASTTLLVTARIDSLAATSNSVQISKSDQADIDSVPGNDPSPTTPHNEDDDDTVNLPPADAASLAGSVWVDANNDGLKDAGEAPIAGTEIRLVGTDRNGNAVSLVTYTDAAGNYSFTGLVPGTYTVTEVQPAAFLDGKDANGTGATSQGTLTNETITSVVLGSNENSVNNNFGELPKASVSGNVYADTDNDGVKDAGETGLGGVLVTLTGTDDLGNPVTLTTTTSADGSYNFPNLRPGTYTVTENQTTVVGYLDGKDTAGTIEGTSTGTAGADTVSAITLGVGQNSVANNFGEVLPARISGQVRDVSVTGTPTPMAGVTVTLTGTDDLGNPVTMTAVTGADGNYTFDGLRPGTYSVTETQPSGFLNQQTLAGSEGGTPGTDTDGNDKTTAITLSAGDSAVQYDFEEIKPAAISGKVINEATGAPIAGVEVKLTGTDDLGNPVRFLTTTLADGTYAFTGLRPGTYRVTETQPAGWLEGNNPSTTESLNATETTNDISNVKLKAGDNSINNDFRELKPSSISGQVRNDFTGAPIAGVTITLTGTDDLGNPVTIVTTTDADGKYTFPDLRPGTYSVTETQPVGYLDKTSTVGNEDGIVETINKTTAIVLPNTGKKVVNVDFTEIIPAQTSGVVYLDLDNDGMQDAGETGIPGITLTLTGTDDQGNPVSIVTTTGVNGEYSFTNLRPGDYTITQTQSVNYVDGLETPGPVGGAALPATPSNDVITVGLLPGDNSPVNNFAEQPLSGLSGTVSVSDINGNASTVGIGGVTITLTGTDDLGNPVTLTTVTDANGDYAFADLRPGTYTVTQTQPDGWADTKNLGDTASNGGTVLGNVTSNIVIGANQDAVRYDFTETKLVSVSGVVHIDHNDDGLVTSGFPIVGAIVTLTGTDDAGNPVSMTTTTDSTGAYQFEGLRPGTYTVTETQPSPYVDGKDAAGSPIGAVAPSLSGADTIVLVLDPSTDPNVLSPAPMVSTNNNFGELGFADISGKVYDSIDPNQRGIGGVTIILEGVDMLGNPVRLTTVTGADGTYVFPNLFAGTYTLTEVQPMPWSDVAPIPGSSGGVPATNKISQIVLKPAVNSVDNNFPEVPALIVPSTPGDPAPVSSVAVSTPETTTGPISTVAGPTVSEPAVTVPTTAPSTVPSGTGTGSVAGTVFVDRNGNGKKDPNERTVGAVTVILTDAKGKQYEVTSDANGAFDFSNIPEGSYSVSLKEIPAGMKLTTKTVVIAKKSQTTTQDVGVPVNSGVEGESSEAAPNQLALSFTGSNSTAMAVLAGGLLLAGSALLMFGRRRRKA